MLRGKWKYILSPFVTEPSLNLAMEEWALRNLDPEYSYLLLYVNGPSVVLGRHQNVLQEVNIRECWKQNIPVLRRISGGGTVVHDYGNINISFITEHTSHNFNRYREFLQPIVQILRDFGVLAEIDEHNNLRVEGFKISGNAQFTSKGRLLSHGTLLFDSDLERMKTLLSKNSYLTIQSHATVSRRANVANVREFCRKKIGLEEFRAALVEGLLGRIPNYYVFSHEEWAQIDRLAREKYRSFAWNIGRSPSCSVFTFIVSTQEFEYNFHYHLKDGVFRDVKVENRKLKFFQELLEGQLLVPETFASLEKRIWEIDNENLQKQAKRIFELLI